MSITQTFYDQFASQYDKLFLDWQAATQEQALLLDGLFRESGWADRPRILDCACGIGTQAIGLAALGYPVTASDISVRELQEAKERAEKNQVKIRFEHADFRGLSETFSERFDIVIAMDNALAHMLSTQDLDAAVRSITDRIQPGGLFVASLRDYDALLLDKPPYSPPYIHKSDQGQRVAFQTWDWQEDRYTFVQYIIDDQETLEISKFSCECRGILREELTNLLLSNGCRSAEWKFPEETGFYQPIVIAKK